MVCYILYYQSVIDIANSELTPYAQMINRKSIQLYDLIDFHYNQLVPCDH